MALQIALAKAGQAVMPDGDFGRLTCDALRRWQKGRGLPEADAIDAQQWQLLTGLPAPTLFDVCLTIVSDFEGTQFDRVVGNFDGAGITFGLIGFTLANGEIRKLFGDIESRRAGAIANAFGALYSEFTSVVAADKRDQLAWADNISLGASKMSIAKPWKDAFERIGQLPEAREAQIQRAYTVYWKVAQQCLADFAAGKPLADQDISFWFDVAVQNSIDAAERKALKASAASALTGEDLRKAWAEIIANGSAPRWRKDVLTRKMSYVSGTGEVHGSVYRLSDWGITGAAVSAAQISAPSSIVALLGLAASSASSAILAPDDEAGEANVISGPNVIPVLPNGAPANVASPHAAWPLYGKFAGFVARLGLRNFTADELLFLGNQNQNGRCSGLNDYPPEGLWENIAPTVAVLDKLRDDVKAPIHFLSLYRAQAYNACIDGSATNSFHMRYRAIDFICDVGNPGTWSARLKEYRAAGIFRGGIGVYRTFVHVDTRGENRDWTG